MQIRTLGPMIRGFGCSEDDMPGVWRGLAEKSTDSLPDSTERWNFTWRRVRGNEDADMVSFQQALSLLLENSQLVTTEPCRIEQASGRVLRENIVADRPFPAFDRVMMDGFALRAADWRFGCRKFRVTGSAPAGASAMTLTQERGGCLEVMTGAPCPTGADAIIPLEEAVAQGDGEVEFSDAADPVAGRFIHRAGSDSAEGELLLAPGCLLGSREIGVAASCGRGWLAVSCLPQIAVVATGDELVPVDAAPAPHQIRQSNAHSLAATLIAAGYPPEALLSLGDDVEVSRPAFEALLTNMDWIILTGAVSQGVRDFVPSLLTALGCREIFHGVAQRPGKPAGLWIGPGGQMIVALPGNPVSALTGLHTLVLPALAAASGQSAPLKRRVVMGDMSPQLADLTRHLPVTLRADGRAEPALIGNSGDFIGLLKSDGYITLPPRGEISAAFPFTSWR